MARHGLRTSIDVGMVADGVAEVYCTRFHTWRLMDRPAFAGAAGLLLSPGLLDRLQSRCTLLSVVVDVNADGSTATRCELSNGVAFGAPFTPALDDLLKVHLSRLIDAQVAIGQRALAGVVDGPFEVRF